MKPAIITLAMLMILGTACSGNTSPSSGAPTASPTMPATDSSTPSKVTSTASTNAASESTPATSKENSSKLYRINKNYDVVPIETSGNKKVVLLTFDDGPKKMEWIKNLIDTLDKHHAKAIFFELGISVKAHPDLLKYTVDHGETIGNHTWDHNDLKKINTTQVDDEINKGQDIIIQTIGSKPAFFRPPNGDANEYVHTVVSQAGMTFMNWSDGSLDWDPKNIGNPDAIIDNVMKQLHPGSNILMHELPTTVQALDKLLSQIEDKGYSFVDPATIQFEPYNPK
ncbi:polysaccharide deacetylase family protein [Paenibacillus sp. GP183]|uniref:polysaccharide deacetylase family protein n=1 Tax=Paenibacillus sp. GP183 TaxID=1882751 RepID=UPI0008998723|nr:polysaccharide deacetylase family protein [Paenibacillus sp. GP183]SED15393.1 Peptidoglycan/xylan/chitin deacetylase, PgdA/CDA1 family [Paenibacillus sp. GP183]